MTVHRLKANDFAQLRLGSRPSAGKFRILATGKNALLTTRLQVVTQSEKCMRKTHGFTLIELMIAIGLTGLLLSMAVPALDMFVANARQTGAVNDFIASLHTARSAAVTTNSRVTVCASASGDACGAVAWDRGWIVFVDSDADQAVDADEVIISASAAVDGLAISSGDFGASMSYRPNGRVMNAAINGSIGEFTVCDRRGADHARVLIVDLSGRPRSSRYLIDGSKPSCAS